jgi:hypothetical protein
MAEDEKEKALGPLGTSVLSLLALPVQKNKYFTSTKEQIEKEKALGPLGTSVLSLLALPVQKNKY